MPTVKSCVLPAIDIDNSVRLAFTILGFNIIFLLYFYIFYTFDLG